MNSRWYQKCISVLACLGIVLLFAVLAIVWVQFLQGSFRESPFPRHDKIGTSGGTPMNYTISGTPPPKSRLKEFRANSYLDSLGLDRDVEYVKPMKMSPLPLHDHDIIFNEMNNYSNRPVLLHHSGHFRHNMTEVWDPHPQYEIVAFGKKLKLQLAHDNNFVGPNLYVSHVKENHTHRTSYNQAMLGCFYSGNVQGDSESDVVVSLCNGMTGYIRTSDGSYYIEPVEFINGTLNSFLHRIKKVAHSFSEDNEVTSPEKTSSPPSSHRCGTNATEIEGNGIEEEFPIALDLHNPIHNLVQRNTANNISSKSQGKHRRKREDKEYLSMDDGEEFFVENRASEYFIKVLVVADKSMLEFYGTKDELNHYILTLMSQTARLFKDPSIGNAISVSVIEIRILERHDFHAADSQGTLSKFCKWREKYTVHTNHDVALLLTRHDFCKDKDQECVTVGVARVGAMCTAASCAIAIDKGLPTTYTIAHEIGHALNMPHDTDDAGKCANLNKGESQKYIMTHSLERDIKPWMWSPCSRHFVTEFLGSKRAKCLLNRPTTNFISTELENVPPGEKYDVQKQCEFEFGGGKDHCLYENEPPCLHLWCTENPSEGCSTHHMPWAEGTYCGSDRWCHNGECIPFKENNLRPIKGGWGPWSSWGECSRTCGGGVKLSKRICDNPIPDNGGDYCSGASTRYASCNTETCADEKEFRAVQCSAFDGNTNNVKDLPKDVRWLPKYGLEKDDQCKLYCRPENSNAYYLLKNEVVDGTKCGFNSFGICFEGKCRSGGCDNKLHSEMQLDECGVCGGDNSQCEEITGSYNVTATSTGYNMILKFPKGSSGIEIRQRDRPDQELKNYLALVDGETGQYILNGNNMREQQKDIIFGASIIKYSGSNALVEMITTAKNEILAKSLILEILTVDSRTPPPDVTYRYIISRENAPRYSWRLYQKEWSDCNSICSGFQFMKPVCIELGHTEQIVDDYFCASRDTYGIVQKKECNNHCRLIWNPTKRGVCSSKCGTGFRNVSYNCMRIDNEKEKYSFLQIVTADTYGDVVDDSYCNMLPEPQYVETCVGSCHVRWQYGDWSQCSQTCGGGLQTRTAQCVDNDNGATVEEQECKGLHKLTQRECKNNKCPDWYTSEWSECSSQCGRGYKTRLVTCKAGNEQYKSYFCDQRTKPRERAECSFKPCVEWSMGEWSICSSTCGIGVQTREVYCQSKDDHKVIDLEMCSNLPKPKTTQSCQLTTCAMPADLFKPRYLYPVDKDETNNSIQVDFGVVDGRWVTGEWSQCSKSCGGGFSLRTVTCKGTSRCDTEKRPVAKTYCNTIRCPQWQTGSWTKCDDNCEKHRLVACRNDSGSSVPDYQCGFENRPEPNIKCHISQCPDVSNTVDVNTINYGQGYGIKYRWKVGKWKECSSRCGKGMRYRNVTCEDTANEVILVDQYCKRLPKPKTNKSCERFNCAFTWIESDWSPCSAKCGRGYKTRNVTCHKVYQGGLLDPNPMPDLKISRYRRNYCDMYKKPVDVQTCKESNCGDIYVWKPGDWSECTQKCGKRGRQTRQLYCINVWTLQAVEKRNCLRRLKPKRKKKCNIWRCAHRSCLEVKNSLHTTENKDYLLDIRGKRAVVYCFKMDTNEPEEYISLSSDTKNFAEIYHKRLLDLNSCPYNGERNDDCHCVDIGARSGLTEFYKVRLNITSMKIVGDDFIFTKQVRGKKIPYGTAGDCYSKAPGCGQGRFSIDLTGTPFKFSKSVTWEGQVTEIHQTDQVVSGKCGGFCGECSPSYDIGLHVEIT